MDLKSWNEIFELDCQRLSHVGQSTLATMFRALNLKLDLLQHRVAPLPESETEVLARDLATRPLTVDDDTDGHPTRREMAHVLGNFSIAITRLGDGLAQHEGTIQELLALFDGIGNNDDQEDGSDSE